THARQAFSAAAATESARTLGVASQAVKHHWEPIFVVSKGVLNLLKINKKIKKWHVCNSLLPHAVSASREHDSIRSGKAGEVHSEHSVENIG
ncbi:hypothetical protein ACO1KR_13645, partial [Staphylococcus aureus]